MFQTDMMDGVAMGGVIQKLSVGRQAAFNQVNRGACDSDFVDTAPETTRGAGRYKKPASGCMVWNASYRNYRRFILKIVAASAAASWSTGRGSIGCKGEKRRS